jgi:hypothetical protein
MTDHSREQAIRQRLAKHPGEEYIRDQIRLGIGASTDDARYLLALLDQLRAEGNAYKKAIRESDPAIASEVDGNLSCYWCRAWLSPARTEHEPDCLWVAAQKP